MRRDRFEELFAYIHCDDNNCFNRDDRFTKLRPLFILLNASFIPYAPEQECYSINRCICQYFGEHKCKPFMKGMPIQFGFKL